MSIATLTPPAPQPSGTAASSRPPVSLAHPPAARALVEAPAGRRRTCWLVIVTTCPACSRLHHHRVDDADGDTLAAGLLVRRCPVTGTVYQLEVASGPRWSP